MTSPHSAKITGVPGKHNPKSGEERLAACLDEIDVLKERYRRALEYMEWFKPAVHLCSFKKQLLSDVCYSFCLAHIINKKFCQYKLFFLRQGFPSRLEPLHIFQCPPVTFFQHINLVKASSVINLISGSDNRHLALLWKLD